MMKCDKQSGFLTYRSKMLYWIRTIRAHHTKLLTLFGGNMVFHRTLIGKALSISVLAIMLILVLNTFCPAQERFPMMGEDPRDFLLRDDSFSKYDFTKDVFAESDFNVEYVSSCLWSDVKDVVVDGDYAYCAYVNGLVILDVSDPTNPDSVSYMYLQGTGEGIDKSGDFVYLADGSEGLIIIDVLDPVNPITIGSYNTPDWAYSVFVIDSLAFIADDYGGLQIIDISDPFNPEFVGNYAERVFSVFVLDTLVYFANSHSGDLQIINVSDPINPYLLGSYDIPGSARSVFVSDTLAYVAAYDSGLQIINVSDPINPEFVGSYNTTGRSYDVFVSDTLAYVAYGSSGVKIINVSEPTNPEFVSSLYAPGATLDVFVSDTLVYVAGTGGFQLFNVSEPVNPDYIGNYDTPSLALGIYVSDTLAYVANWNNGLSIVNISDINSPYMVGNYDTRYAQVVFLSDSLAYIADGSGGLKIINVSDPTNPEFVGEYSGDAMGVFVSDTLAYVGSGLNGLVILNVSDPTTPVYVGSSDIIKYAYNVFVVDTLAYVADGTNGVQIINVSEPTNPIFVSNYDTPNNAFDIVVLDTLLYVADGYSGLRIINVSDPVNPTYVGSYYTSGGFTTHFFISNDHAYLTNGDKGLQIVSISDPTNPELVGSYDTPGHARRVFVSDSLVYLADGSSLMVLKTDFSIYEGPVWHVSIYGLETGDGSEADPLETIQHAIDLASDGDTVLVHDGIYIGDGNRDIDLLGKRLIVMSENGPENTMIKIEGSASNPHRGFYIHTNETSSTKIIGFNIVGGYTPGGNPFGGGIWIENSSPRIINCWFSQNYANIGGAILISNGSPWISNCIFKDNDANWSGGAIFFSHGTSGASLRNCLITENYSDYYGGGIGLNTGAEPTLSRCTIVKNRARVDGAGLFCSSSSPTLYDCIIAYNFGKSVECYIIAPDLVTDPPSNPYLYQNDVYGNSGGNWVGCIADLEFTSGNFTAKPLFCDTSIDNYSLDANSPCAPAANGDTLIGAYDVGCGAIDRSTYHVSTIGNDISGDGSEAAPFATIQHGIDMATASDTVLVHEGTYTGDGNRDIDFLGKAIVVKAVDGIIVDIDCQADSLDMHRGFIFSNGEDSTSQLIGLNIVNGYSQSGGGVSCTNNSSPMIRNISITNCKSGSTDGGGIFCDNSSPYIYDCYFSFNSTLINGRGGGIAIRTLSNPVIDNCNFFSNVAGAGGGIFSWNNSSPQILNCTFDSNEASISSGGGLLDNNASSLLNSCYFKNNISANNGGAITAVTSNLSLLNCTIVNNDAPYGGAITVFTNSTVQISNSILAFNTSSDNDNGSINCGDENSTITIDCTDIFGNTNGDWVDCIAGFENLNGNFSLDPLFCDTALGDFHIEGSSICAQANNSCGVLIGALGVGCNIVPKLNFDTDYLTFTTTDDAIIPPVSQQIQITSSAAELDWELTDIFYSNNNNSTWLSIDKISGTTPDNITVSVDRGILNPGVYTAVLVFDDLSGDNSQTYVQVSFFINDGTDIVDQYTKPGASIEVPIVIVPIDSLARFTIPLVYSTFQPDKVSLDSVIAMQDIGGTIIIIDDTSFICYRDTEEPILPDSNSYQVATAYFTFAPDAVSEVIIIDTTTLSFKADYSYQFTYRNNDIYTTVVPAFDLGRIYIESEACCVGMRGNIDNDSEDIINILDLTYLVDYMFKQGPEIVCIEEADLTLDCVIDISDLTYIIDYMFRAGPPPPACIEQCVLKAYKQSGDVTINSYYGNNMTTLSIDSDFDLKGIQIELIGSSTEAPVKLADKNIEMFYHEQDGQTRIGLLDLQGSETIKAGSTNLVQLNGEYEIISAVVADINHQSVIPSIGEALKQPTLPDVYSLNQNYPNPFNPVTQIEFALPNPGEVKLVVYNVIGQKVTTLIDGSMQAGYHSIEWDGVNSNGNQVSSGVYFYKIHAGDYSHSKKMLLLK